MSTRSLYATLALVDLTLQPQGSWVALPDIAHRQGIPLAYLEQLFVKLRRAGFVTSGRGQKGGYALAHSPRTIHVAAILEAMGEMPQVTRCGRGRRVGVAQTKGCLPGGTTCRTHRIWAQLEDRIKDYLSSISLADICTHPDKGLADVERMEGNFCPTILGREGEA